MRHLIFCCALLAAGPCAAREPAVAGQFYPADPAELARTVDAYLAAAATGYAPAGDVAAAISPHAGYEFSGRLAALAVRNVADSYDTVVVLATGHTEGVKGAALLASDDYATPLGKVPTDRKLAAALLKASPLFEDRPSAHAREHAVEVQLPFLQRRLKKPFKLLAAVLNTDDQAALKKIGAALAGALRGRKALILVSSDFSHYPTHSVAGPADGAMALAIGSMDPALVGATSRVLLSRGETGLETCACGEAAIEAGMEAARLLGARSFEVLKLSDSYSEAPGLSGPDRVVGYLAGLFLKTGAPAPLALDKREKAFLLAEARGVIADALEGKKTLRPLAADPRLDLPGAAFVTLTLGGALRGCVGTVEPVMTLADAVRYGAFSAAFRDGRFSPLTAAELPKVKMEVSVLSRLKPSSAAALKPGRDGAVVEKDGRSGLFLPQVWEQLPDRKEFLDELCEQKAGLPRDCWKDPAVKIYSFTVDAFAE